MQSGQMAPMTSPSSRLMASAVVPIIVGMRTLTLSLLATAAVAALAPAMAGAATSSNGTYYGASTGQVPQTGPLQVLTATVRDGRIASASYYAQPFVGYGQVTSPLVGVPAQTTFTSVRINHNGSFTLPLPTVTQNGLPSYSCVSGKLKRAVMTLAGSGYVGNGLQAACSSASFYGIGFTARKATLSIPNGTYTGTSTTQQGQDPDGPTGPPSGPVGSVALQVLRGDIVSGTGSFTPVNPTNGATETGQPPVAVTYAAAQVSNRTGLFTLPSTPAGYDLCGAFVRGGTVAALVACQQASYLPATLALIPKRTPPA